MSRDSQTDSSRDGSGQLRKSDPDVMAINTSPFTLADEKRMDPDSVGTASDYAGTTTAYRSRETGTRPVSSQYVDTEDQS